MAEPGQKIGPYRIVRKIGEGGMGVVFEGVHELIERKVAIKILHAQFAKQPQVVSRFFNEARVVNRIDHPGLVQISDYGELEDKTAYIVMELLNGEALSARLKRVGGALSVEQVLNFGHQIGEALAAAHEKEVIHRDLKPDNVMIVADSQAPGGERTKVLDFGIAKVAGSSRGGQAATVVNSPMGTAHYMSPEQSLDASKVDSRTDVYSLGVMLYEVLCGKRPFAGGGPSEIMVQHLTEEPRPLLDQAPQVPKSLAALVHRMLVKRRDERPFMNEVVSELESLVAQAPPPPRLRTANQPIVSAHPPEVPSPSTLPGTAAGQANLPKQRVRTSSRIAAVLAVLVLLGAFVLTAQKRRLAGSAQREPTGAAVRPIRFHIRSTPSGAAVIQVSDNQVLGKTPWVRVLPAEKKMLKLRLQLPGYAQTELELDQSTGASRTEALIPLHPPSTTSTLAEKLVGTQNAAPPDADAAKSSSRAHRRHNSASGKRSGQPTDDDNTGPEF